MSLLTVGDQVGERYTIQEEIGRGGMQVVYRAFDDTLERDVALKVPQDAQVSRRFRESAVLAARVNHPNVAKTLDYFEDQDGRAYLVEELVVGPNLKKIASQFHRLDPHAVAYVLHHLARGVAASHRAEVVHRDLKPSNVLVGGDLAFQSVKITDFGIAKMAEKEIGDAVADGLETTRSATAIGAIAYMAPEVIEDPHAVSKPADVWGIAAIAWQLLTGRPPFGSSLKAVRDILKGEKPVLPREVTKHPQFGPLSAHIGDLLLRCLERDAASRPSAEELAPLCDDLCYLPLVRETGTIERYHVSSFGFIRSDGGSSVFFHEQSIVGAAPQGTRVWYSKFDGAPHPRAMPVVPMKPDAPAATTQQ